MTLRARLLIVLEALAFGLLLAVAAHAAECPLQGDLARPFAGWGARCGNATGSCADPYQCLWPPDCRCDLQPLGMHRDPRQDGWKKPAPVAQGMR